MPDETGSAPGADLSAVIGAYLEAVDEGRPPDPGELIARHPELARDLRRFLAAQGSLERIAGPLRPPVTSDPGGAETVEIPLGSAGHDDWGSWPPFAAGRYKLLAEIARGGIGVVFRARDTSLNRDIAVKTLQDRYTAASPAARRFLDEARITARLQHPGIPPVHDIGTLPDGRPFLAMKLIQGRTLADLLGDRTADRGFLLAAFEQVCHAVAYAHSRGVIHRDLKPQNVMVGAFGEVQVMDWGLAKQRGDGEDPDDHGAATQGGAGAPDQTAAGTVLGTPAFMSPEQAGGEIEKVDERADVFGLGAILCVVLTGRPPYTGETTREVHGKAVRAELGEAFGRMDDCGAEPDLVDLCRRCLSADRDARPSDAGKVAAAVAGFRAAAEERARQAELDRVRADAERRGLELRAAAERRRRRAQQRFAATVVLFLSAGGGFAWWADRQATQGRERVARNDAAIGERVARCEAALRAEDADAAADALTDAERRMPEGGGEEFVARLARSRDDLDLLRALDRADDLLWEWDDRRTGPRPDFTRRAVAEWRAAFERFGVPLDRTSPGDLVRRVNGSLVRDRLIATLDMLILSDRSGDALEALRVVDPDPFRDDVRAAVRDRDDARLQALAGRPDALRQPVGFAVMVGHAKPIPAGRREVILRDAYVTWPGRLPTLMAMGELYPPNRRAGAEERVGWYRAAVAVRPRNAVAWNKLGIALRDRGDAAGAEAAFRTALQLNPAMVMARINLGVALQDKGDLPGAIGSMRQAVRLDQTHAHAHLGLGTALQQAGELEGAIDSFREAVRLDPGLATAHSNLSVVLVRKREFAAGVASGRAAVTADPSDARAHFNLGAALQANGELPAALASFKDAVRLDPGYASAHSNLAAALRATGDPKGAIESLREAVRLDPTLAAAHTNLGLALQEKGDPKAAIESHREAVRLAPRDARIRLNLGTALQASGDVQSALAEFLEATRLDSSFAAAHSNLGAARAQTNNLGGAIESFRKAVQLDPKLVGTWINLGTVLMQKGDARGAVEALEKAVQIDPTFAVTGARPVAQAHFNLGTDLLKRRELVGAVAAFRKAVKYDPSLVPAHNNLGAALEDLGDTDGAIAAYRAAVKAGPREAMAHYNLANRLAARGDSADAIAAYREAVRLDPTFPQAWCNLGHALRDRGEFAEALKHLKRGHELGGGKPGWPYPSGDWVKDCEELIRQDGRLTQVLAGKATPEKAADLLAFARICGYRQQYAAGVRFYKDAFTQDPDVAGQVQKGLRARAAVAAVLAAAGAGRDPLPTADRPDLRRQALDWLRADLAAWAAAGAATRPAAHEAMTEWLADPALAYVAHPFWLIALPANEVKDWLAFWAEVRQLRDRTAPPSQRK